MTIILEQKDALHRLFEGMEPQRIIQQLGLYFNQCRRSIFANENKRHPLSK